RGDNDGVRAFLAQAFAEALALRSGAFAGIGFRVRLDLGHRDGGTIVPNRIDGILRDGDEFGAGGFGRGADAVETIRAMELRIVADLGAFRRALAQIGRHAAIDEVAILEERVIDLGADLQRVAAVDEDCGFVGQYYGGAGRAGKARGPGE